MSFSKPFDAGDGLTDLKLFLFDQSARKKPFCQQQSIKSHLLTERLNAPLSVFSILQPDDHFRGEKLYSKQYSDCMRNVQLCEAGLNFFLIAIHQNSSPSLLT